MSTHGLLTAAPAFALLLWAAIEDLRSRRIPNWLTFSLVLSSIAQSFMSGHLVSPSMSLLGFAVGFGIPLILFLIGALGGGDVKLLAAFGAWLGPGTVCWAAIYGAIAGGLLAIPWLLVRGRLKQTLANVWGLLGFWRLAGIKPHPGLTLDTPGAIRMPYALPVSIGALIALWR